ncbi:MAG: hypothetical protein GY718_09965 [Lentisphaerae bacterium]|nr:hypothetical protein [Lentisphaerota bacterium]
MKLKKARTCNCCVAVMNAETICDLGFNNRGDYDRLTGTYKVSPQEKCYKLLTNKDFFEAKRNNEIDRCRGD